MEKRGRATLPSRETSKLPVQHGKGYDLVIVYPWELFKETSPKHPYLELWLESDYDKAIKEFFEFKNPGKGYDSSDKTHLAWHSKMCGAKTEIKVDENNRLTFSAEHQKYARLEGRVVFHGDGSHFEVWNPDVYDACQEQLVQEGIYDNMIT